MLCLAIGLGVLGFAAMRRARCCHDHGGPYGRRGSWHPRHHRHHRGRRWMLHGVLARIDATPVQERAIVAELDQLVDRVRATRAGFVDARGDLGAAFRGPTLDDGALAPVLGRIDLSVAETRAAVLEALRNVHGMLDDRQRAQVADLLEQGGGFWRRGPYR